MESKAALPADKGGWRAFLAAGTNAWMLSIPAVSLTVLAYLLLAGWAAVITNAPLFGALAATVVALLVQVVLLTGSFRLFLQRGWWERHLVTRTAYIALIVFLSGWVSRAVFRAFVGDESARVESGGMWVQRVAALLFITAGWTALDAYRRSLASEQQLQEQLLKAREVAVRTVEQHRHEVVERIREMLAEALQEPRGLNQRSLDQARERIRFLSHELQDAAPAYQPQMPEFSVTPGWRVVAQSVLGRPIIQPMLMALTVTIFFFAQTVSTDVTSVPTAPTGGDGVQVSVDLASFGWSLAYLLMVFFVTWTASTLAKRLTERRLPTLPLGARAAWVLLTPLLLAVVVQVVIELAYVWPGFSDNLDGDLTVRLAATIPIFLIALLILIYRTIGGLFAIAQVNQRALTQELQWQVARANETLVQERRHLSLAVHGPLQSTVASISLALQEAALGESESSSDSRAREMIVEVVDRLELGPAKQRSLATEVELLTSTWLGVCDITLDADPQVLAIIDADWVSAGTVADVLIEAVANAAVHGGASRVWITMRMLNVRTLLVEVGNNGAQASVESGTGLGSKMLDDVSLAWQLEAAEEGMVLRVWLPSVGQVQVQDELALDLATVLDRAN